MNQLELCNIVNNDKCCVSDKAFELLDKEVKGHDVSCCFEELLWMSRTIKILENHIPAGTLESQVAVNACGVTNTVIGFAPIPPPTLFFDVLVFEYNGSPLVPPATVTSIIAVMDAIIAALSTASGVTWSYVQIGNDNDFEFYLCAPYTRNGDNVELLIQVSQEGILGNIRMDATLSGGVAPITPAVFRTEADNCLTEIQIAKLSGKFCRVKINRPRSRVQSFDIELRNSDLDLEFR